MCEVRRPTKRHKDPRTRKSAMIPPEITQGQYALTVEELDLSKKNKKPYFDAQQYVNDMLEKRTNAALKQKNAEFAKVNAETGNEELLAYLKKCAAELGHHPHMEEVIGGSFIAKRFGTWQTAMKLAGLMPLGVKPQPNRRMIYKKELKIQAALYRQAKKQKAQARLEKQQAKKRCQPGNDPETYIIE